jgi:hypothetical protein
LTGIVIDASVALAWCFPDEASEYADGVLVALEGRAILVPALWSVEITNAVLMAERRKRVKQPEIRRFVALLDALTVIMDSQSITESVTRTRGRFPEQHRTFSRHPPALKVSFLDVETNFISGVSEQETRFVQSVPFRFRIG